MNRPTLRDIFPASIVREWNWIDHAISSLTTNIGLITKWQSDNGGSRSHDEISESLDELERHLKSLFTKEAEWRSEIGAETTASEQYQARSVTLDENRRALLRDVHRLRETSKHAASGSEWEELALAVACFRASIANYCSLECNVASCLTSVSTNKGTPAVKTTTAASGQDRPRTHRDEARHSDADTPRRRLKPR